MSEITYAKSGGPPDDWRGLRVLDLDTGQEVTEVEEVNTVEGWVMRAKTDADGNCYLDETGEAFAMERLEGRFAIKRPDSL